MAAKTGRNDPCPCGSGVKFKRCCVEAALTRPFTREERLDAIAALQQFSESHLASEGDEAFEEFWGDLAERIDEVDECWDVVTRDVLDAWFWFDRPLPDGRCAVDWLLERAPRMPTGQRRFLEGMRNTSLRLYEVTDVCPGVSVSVRDIFVGGLVTVRELLGSRTMMRGELFAARVLSNTASGQPEFEAGLLHIPALSRRALVDFIGEMRVEYQEAHPGAADSAFFKEIPPVVHTLWMQDVLDPPMPHLRNGEGEDLLWTRTTFEVRDRERLISALAAAETLEADDDDQWHWLATIDHEPTSLGLLRLQAGVLVLETNSAGRGERGRRMVETLAGDAIRHRSTTHEDVTEQLRAMQRAGPDALPADPDPLLREQIEELALGRYARHYRGWLDEPVPALGGRTPRAAVKDASWRDKVAELVRGIEGMYQKALRADQPAYDPSWMWAELGIEDAEQVPGKPLGHDRWADALPGLGGLSRSVAERVRQRPGFDDASSLVRADDLDTDLQARRFLADHDATGTRLSTAVLRRWLACMADFELHRRKTFRVDESLAFLLAQTELDVEGQQLRVPFPCFALVFTDRHMLSLAERLLAGDRHSPLAGHFLRVLTIYVSEEPMPDHRVLRLRLAPDALGADPPDLMEYSLVVRDDARVEPLPVGFAPPGADRPAQLPDVRPLPGLCHVVLSAILYATSADAVTRPETRARRTGVRATEPGTDSAANPGPEQVFFLPGSIDISGVRRLQELVRAPSGKTLLHRFMVRGHWRRAAASWHDQRLRWVAPYWKGPEIAMVIERAYRMKP